jgi:MobA/MobL family
MRDRYDPNIPGGGEARGSGGSFHLSFRSGSRGRGASGAAAHDYVTREGEYDDENRDPAIYTESDHMPSWAEEDPREYWDAADLYERANGRLYVSADFALPRELSVEDQIELARDFAHDLTDEEQLPYTLAIHEGRTKVATCTIRMPISCFLSGRMTVSDDRATPGSGVRIVRILNGEARRRAARSTDLAGWSRPASAWQSARTRRSSEPEELSAWIIAAISVRASIKSLAVTTARPRRMSSRAAKTMSVSTMRWRWQITSRPSARLTRRSRDSRARGTRLLGMGCLRNALQICATTQIRLVLVGAMTNRGGGSDGERP